MTAQATYEMVCGMLYDFDLRTGNKGAENVISDPFTWIKQGYIEFYRMAAEMIIDCRSALDKAGQKTGGNKRISALKRLLKVAEKSGNSALHGIFEQSGKFCACDGFRIVRLNNDLDSLPHVEKDRPQVNLSGIMDQAIREKAEQVETPSAAELKEFISKAKAKAKANNEKAPVIVYKIGCAWVNPQYLLDMIEILPDCQIFVTDRKKPLYFCTNDGEDGVLLPVNHKE